MVYLKFSNSLLFDRHAEPTFGVVLWRYFSPFVSTFDCFHSSFAYFSPPYIYRKWMSWYEKNKRRNWNKIDLADSPKKRDVDEAYAGHQERRKKRFARMRTEAKHSGGRARDVSVVQDEAALPEWAYREKT